MPPDRRIAASLTPPRRKSAGKLPDGRVKKYRARAI